MKVKLNDVIDSLDMVDNQIEYYYNPLTNEFFPSNIGDYENLNEDELDDLFLNSIILPTKYEIDEYRILNDFILTIKDTKISDELLSKIKCKGFFRRFKDTLIKFNIIQDWYDFRQEQYKIIAVNWCNKNNIEFE